MECDSSSVILFILQPKTNTNDLPSSGVGRGPSHTSRLHRVLITALSPVPHWLTDGKPSWRVMESGLRRGWAPFPPRCLSPSLSSRPPGSRLQPPLSACCEETARNACSPKAGCFLPFSGGALSVEVVAWSSDLLTIGFGLELPPAHPATRGSGGQFWLQKRSVTGGFPTGLLPEQIANNFPCQLSRVRCLLG